VNIRFKEFVWIEDLIYLVESALPVTYIAC